MKEEESSYALRTELQIPYDQAIERVRQALKQEGFGVLTEIDVRDTLKRKIDVDFRRYIILGACNPPLAHQALSAELEIGLLLPCNVIVFEQDGGSGVAILDPIAMMGIAANPDLEPVAEEARGRLERVIGTLSG